MPDNSTTFIKRVISALLAGLVVFSLGYFGGTKGLEVLCTIAIILAIREYSRMAFTHWQMPAVVSRAYYVICALLYMALFLHFTQSLILFAFANIMYFTLTLWLARGLVTNENLLAALAMGSFGLIYCVLLPFFCVRIVLLEHGGQWFLFLLLVVFFGDTFAYFSGRWLGRHKLMPSVSPNKTWEGAIGGLVGSMLSGTLQATAAFNIPWYYSLIFCLFCGIVAQSGDLLMSLVKRVAHVKDSGHIMPGHGGILDRLDGIFIACPLVYVFALYTQPN
jgi:phosphatidate cytidylyltransferase